MERILIIVALGMTACATGRGNLSRGQQESVQSSQSDSTQISNAINQLGSIAQPCKDLLDNQQKDWEEAKGKLNQEIGTLKANLDMLQGLKAAFMKRKGIRQGADIDALFAFIGQQETQMASLRDRLKIAEQGIDEKVKTQKGIIERMTKDMEYFCDKGGWLDSTTLSSVKCRELLKLPPPKHTTPQPKVGA